MKSKYREVNSLPINQFITDIRCVAAVAALAAAPAVCFAGDQYYTFGGITSDGSFATSHQSGTAGPYSYTQDASATHNTSASSETLTVSGGGTASSDLTLNECSSCAGGDSLITYAAAWGSGHWYRDSAHDDDSPRAVNLSLDISGSISAQSDQQATGTGTCLSGALAHSEAYAGGSEIGTNKAVVHIDTSAGSPAPTNSCSTITYQESECHETDAGTSCHGYAEWTMSCYATYYSTSKNLNLTAKIYCEADANFSPLCQANDISRIWGHAGASSYASGSITMTPH